MKKNLLLSGANREAVVRIFGMCALSALITLFIACENPFLRLADKKIVLPPGREVSGLMILKQPDKMSYTHGDILDLTGLAVTLTYDDGTYENVLFEELAERNITTLPAQGASVSHSNHNAKVVIVKLGEFEAQTTLLTIGKREIKIADVNIIGPMKNAIPNTEASVQEDAYYSAGEVSWTPSHDSFIGETIYMASLALVPDNDHIFASDIEAIINGYAETVITENTGSLLNLSLEFAKTLNKVVTGILVVNQPLVLTYPHGDTFDITGLTVNILYDDNTSEIVPDGGFHSRNISVSPYDCEHLHRSVHNGHPVVVSLGDIHANTNNLIINKRNISINTVAAPVKTYDANTSAAAGNVTFTGLLQGDTLELNTDYTRSAVFANAAAGTNKQYTYTVVMLNTPMADNYNLSVNTRSNTNGTINKKEITLSFGNITRTLFTPLSGETTSNITMNVSGIITGQSPEIIYTCTAITGLTLTNTTLTYNGTTAFSNPSVTLNFTADAGSNYTLGTSTINVAVYDGQANYTGAAGTYDRRIPVTSANINAFNVYANTTAGLTRHYKLTQNVTLAAVSAGSNWTAIGNSSHATASNYIVNKFTGSFNGQGYYIANLTIRVTSYYSVYSDHYGGGMFGYIGENAVVQNLALTNCFISGSLGGSGAFACENNGTVQNCYSTAQVYGNSPSGGGDAGGIVGINNGMVQNCYAVNGEVVASAVNPGGIVGRNRGTVQNCYASVNVTNGLGGGIVGTNYGVVQNCYATGNVIGSYTGGIAGTTSGATVINCVALNRYVISSNNNSSYVGRIIGYISSGITLDNNYARSDMTIRYNTSTTYTPTSSLRVKDGLNITSTNWNSAAWWQNTAKFPAASWEFRAGLPILRNMPAGTQNPTVVQ